MNRTVA